MPLFTFRIPQRVRSQYLYVGEHCALTPIDIHLRCRNIFIRKKRKHFLPPIFFFLMGIIDKMGGGAEHLIITKEELVLAPAQYASHESFVHQGIYPTAEHASGHLFTYLSLSDENNVIILFMSYCAFLSLIITRKIYHSSLHSVFWSGMTSFKHNKNNLHKGLTNTVLLSLFYRKSCQWCKIFCFK